MAAPIIRYEFQSIHTGADMKPFGEGTPTVGVTYGDYTGGNWDISAAQKAKCRVTISYSGVNWVLNADNSITVSGRITKAELKREYLSPSIDHQDVWVWFGDPEQQVFHQQIGSSQAGTWDLLPSQYRNFSITIPASNSPQEVKAVALHYKNRNTEKPASWDDQYPPDEFRIGLFVTNPNLPTYRPGKILDNADHWQSHNRSGGADNVYTGSFWQTMPTAAGHEKSDNPPLIMTNSNFVNMLKIGENA